MITSLGLVILVTSALVGQAPSDRRSIWIDASGYEAFHVVTPKNSSPDMLESAEVFRKLWETSTGNSIKINDKSDGKVNVLLGRSIISGDLLNPAELYDLSPQGCLVRTYTPPEKHAERGIKKQLFFAGATDEAIEFGISTFFYHFPGARWLAPGVSLLPRARFTMPVLDLRSDPAMPFREISLNAFWKTDPKEYRRGVRLPKAFCPPPPGLDYFSALLAPGAAAAGPNTVAYGNEAGAQQLAQTLREMAKQFAEAPAGTSPPMAAWPPGANTWSLSGLEGLVPVLSPEGAALNESEDSPCAAIVWTANRVASLLAEIFPVNPPRVHILLPPALRKPPKQLAPVSGVVVQLSDADLDFARSTINGALRENLQFKNDLAGWDRLKTCLYILDYQANRADTRRPFPNFHTVQDNIQCFVQHDVKGVYVYCGAQGGPDSVHLGALRAYLSAILLFDPDLDGESVLRDFCKGYYGAASPKILDYIALIKTTFDARKIPLSVDDDAAWWDAAAKEKAKALLNEALALTENPDIKSRVQTLLESCE